MQEQELLELTPTLIVTRGEAGSYLFTAAGRRQVPAVRPSQVQDPTGAGDAYRAGLLKGLALGLSWEESARLGAVLASFCVEQQGTQEHRLEISQFWERYRENFGAAAAGGVGAMAASRLGRGQGQRPCPLPQTPTPNP